MNNFGVEPFLDHFVTLAPPPRQRTTSAGALAPDAPTFSGFVFKIQANMDPNHRDRIAFVRICSGRFTRGMDVFHVRTGKTLALTRPLQFMAQERTMIDEAYSGDIIGLWDGGNLRIGDTLCEGPQVEFEGIPRFSPEHFVRVRLTDPLKRKQLKKGLDQLSEEGAVQLFFDRTAPGARPGAGRGRRAAVRGDPAPPEVRVRRQRRLRPSALPARALDRGRAGEPGQVRAPRLDHVGAGRRGAAAGAVRQRLGDAHRHTGQPAAAVHRRRAAGTRRAPAA